MGKSQAKIEEQNDRETRLQEAIKHDHVDELHRLIVEEPGLLDRVSKHPFPNTPLHLAAAEGSTQVAMEMAILKPSFTRKLNPEGYSPMHLALQKKHYHTVRALMTIDPKLIRVRGRCGITPLHYLAAKGDDEQELLAEFLCACKSSIEDLTSRCETAVHVAIKNYNLEAFNVLFGWLERVYLTGILHWKDEDGNTVLHIAELYIENRNVRSEIVKRLKRHVNVNAKNFQGLTAREMSQPDPSGDVRPAKTSQPYSKNLLLSEYLKRERTAIEKHPIWFGQRNKSARDMILLVASLVATATYQAGLTPPGGYWSDDSSNPLANSTVVTANSSGIAFEKPHEAGHLILSGSDLCIFTAFNSLVFLASLTTIWITAIPLWPRTFPVYMLTVFVVTAYYTTLLTEFSKHDVVAIGLLLVFTVTWLIVAVGGPFLLLHNHRILQCRIDATWRRIGDII